MSEKHNENSNRKTVVGVGSALMDLLVHEDDVFLQRLGAAKGGMLLVDGDFADSALEATEKNVAIAPGGSACNTIVGIARLGGPARFVGKAGSDELGERYIREISASGVEARLSRIDSPTGRVLSVITPDAQRSMFTFLGASAQMTPEDVLPLQFADAAVAHIEGYLCFNAELIQAVVQTARRAGAKICLDLASYTVVEGAGELLHDLVDGYVDILLANEDEARVFTGLTDEAKALEQMAQRVEVAVLKQGKRGSLIHAGGHTYAVEAVLGEGVIDTTGAGDLWAAGFLYGLVHSLPWTQCGQLASACGYEVCLVNGAVIPDDGYARIRERCGLKCV
jgi:sugar/nucleoside kinase (ribokinase family)